MCRLRATDKGEEEEPGGGQKGKVCDKKGLFKKEKENYGTLPKNVPY